jgi:hypothetical protein
MHADFDRLRTQIAEFKSPDIGTIVDEAVQEYIRLNPGAKYSKGLAEILRTNPDLAKKYRDSFVSSPADQEE